MENTLNDLIKASLDGIKGLSDTNAVVGSPIQTPSGVTVIPVSRISLGLAGGGVDFSGKRTNTTGLGNGSGGGITITPLAFLTVSKDADVSLIYIKESVDTAIGKITNVIEKSPEILKKLKDTIL